MKYNEIQVNWLEVCRVGAEELVNTWVAAECDFDRLVDKQRYRNDVIYIIIKMHPPPHKYKCCAFPLLLSE